MIVCFGECPWQASLIFAGSTERLLTVVEQYARLERVVQAIRRGAVSTLRRFVMSVAVFVWTMSRSLCFDNVTQSLFRQWHTV